MGRAGTWPLGVDLKLAREVGGSDGMRRGKSDVRFVLLI